MITVLVNVLINNKIKLDHFRYSVSTLRNVSNNWLINVRGKLRDQAIEVARANLKARASYFCLLDDNRGWIDNALTMLSKARHNYILIFNEDHSLIAPHSIFQSMINDAVKYKVDYIPATWWHYGKYAKGLANVTASKETSSLRIAKLNKQSWTSAVADGHDYYLISQVAVFRKSFLVNMMIKDSQKLPIIISHHIFSTVNSLKKKGFILNEQVIFQKINRITGYRLKRYEKNTPFELEKDPSRVDMLPFVIGVPQHEILACIDKDHGCSKYKLISRGLYPEKCKEVD